MENIKKVWFLLSSHQRFIVGFLILGILINAMLEAFTISLVLPLIGLINNLDNVQNYAIMVLFAKFFRLTDNREVLIYFFYLFAFLFVLKTAFFICLGYYRQRFVADVMNQITGRLFNFYLRNTWDFHLNKNSSALQNNIVVQVGAICTGLISSLLMLVTEILVTIAIIILLITTNIVATLIVFAIVGFTSLIFFSLIKGKLEAYGVIAQEFMEKMIKSVNEAFGGVKEIKVLGREGYYGEKFQKNVIKYTQSWIYPAFIHLIQRSMIEMVFIGSIVIISLYILIVGGDTSYLLGVLSLFAAAAFRLMPSVSRITLSISTIKYYTPILNTIYDDIKKAVANVISIEDKGLSEPNIPIFKKNIQLENVSFYYPNTKHNVIDNISIHIPKGYSVGFIGTSGAGKTTIIDIILGLFKPTSGRAMVDGKDIHENLKLWQKQIGYIPQNIFLSDNSIRNNIAFGLNSSQINDDKVWQAINNAQLGEVVKNLPQGLDTIIGENGLKISGGQRQRIGIARALYNDPDVLVLDEATSSLDSETEKEISSAIEKLSAEKTLLIIAHRLSTLENCDLQFHLKNGKIEKTVKR